MSQPLGGLSKKTLALLTLAVLAAHALVLQLAPVQLGLEVGENGDQRALSPAFTTRQIEPAAKAATAPTTQAPSKSGPAAPQQPVLAKKQSKVPAVSVNSSEYAINSVALGKSEPAVVSPPPGAPEPLPVNASAPAAASSTVASMPPATTGTSSLTTAALPGLPPGEAITVVTGVRLPPSVRLEYDMRGSAKGLNYQASSELDWRNSGTQYEARMTVSAFLLGSRSLFSSGQITATGLAPTRFLDKSRSEQAAHFEADKGKITFSANTPDAPWAAGAQDRVSVFLQLGGVLAAAQNDPAAFPVGSSITLYTVGPREADTWTFVLEAIETLPLLGSDTNAIKLTRKPRREFDQRVEVWLAPALGYLPVRNRVTQPNGDFIDQQLKALIKP